MLKSDEFDYWEHKRTQIYFYAADICFCIVFLENIVNRKEVRLSLIY